MSDSGITPKTLKMIAGFDEVGVIWRREVSRSSNIFLNFLFLVLCSSTLCDRSSPQFRHQSI